MPEDWYKGRMPRGEGYQARDCRVALKAKDWEKFDQIAREAEWSRSKTASALVARQLRLFILGVLDPKTPDEQYLDGREQVLGAE